MESELREALAGIDAAVIAKLAANDIRTLEDAQMLTSADLDSLGFTIGVRNRVLKVVKEHVPTSSGSALSSVGGSMKSLLGILPTAPPVPGEPVDLSRFKKIFDFGGLDKAAKAKRDKLYPCWDLNDNGFLSLAEVDQSVKVTLISELKSSKEGERIWKKFRKSYIRAFVDAADAAPQRKSGGTVKLPNGRRRVVNDDDYVTRREFRLLICYLGIYATMYELFSLIDGGTEGVTVEDDNRISKAEWVAALPLMQAAAKSWAPFEALKTATADSFSQVDANGGGYIVLTEMCEWIENGEKTAGTEMGKVLGVGE